MLSVVYNDIIMIRTNVFLTQRQLDRLKSESEASGLKVAEMVRRAIDEYLDRAGRKQREEGALWQPKL